MSNLLGLQSTVFLWKGLKFQPIRSEKANCFLAAEWFKFETLPRKYPTLLLCEAVKLVVFVYVFVESYMTYS